MATVDRRGVTVSATDPPIAGDPNPGLAYKAPARLATTGANIVLSGLQTIDGVALAAADRVLVKDQTDATTNGLYNASSGPWTRTVDANGNEDFAQGMQVLVAQGSANAGQVFELSSAPPITLGATNLVWAAAIRTLTIGTGLTVVGGTLQLAPPTAATLGGVESIAAVPHQWLNSIDTSGVPHTAQPAVTDLAAIAGSTLVGNNTGGAAVPSALTGALATLLLSTFLASGASHAKGLVPDPGAISSTARFLREDASFAAALPCINVQDPAYGAKGNTVFGSADGAITSGQALFTNTSVVFTAADVGKVINVAGAGAAGAILATTIASFNSAHSVNLAANASTTVGPTAKYDYGTDDTAAINAAIVAAAAAGGIGRVYCPQAVYFVKKLNLANLGNLTFFGDGWNKTYFIPNAQEGTYGQASGHVFDLAGSLNINLRDFQLGWFGQIQAPTTGVLLAQIASGASNAIILTNIYISGQYTASPYHNISVPSSQLYSCKFYNYFPGAGARYVGVFTSNNATFNLTSSFATINPGASQCSDITGIGNEWHFFPGASASSQVLWFDGASDIRLYGGNVTGGGTAYILITNTVARLVISGDTFETESEPVTPSFVFSLSASAVLNGLTWHQSLYIVGTPTLGLMTIAVGGQFQSAGAGQVLAFTSAGGLAAGATYFVGPADSDTVAASNVAVTMTERGLLLNMWVNTSASPGQTPGYTCTVLVNGTATALTGVISGAGVQVKDIAHAVQVNAGDTVCLKLISAAATNTTRVSAALTFLPTG